MRGSAAIASLVAVATMVAAPADARAKLDPTVIEARVANAACRETAPGVVVTAFQTHGVSGTQTVSRSGADDLIETTFGPFRYARGTFHGMSWRRNGNGETIVGGPQVSGDRRTRESVVRIDSPIHAYVLSRFGTDGFGTRAYVDAATWHVVREEKLDANGVRTIASSDFRAAAGCTRPWKRVERDELGHVDAVYRIRSISTRAVDERRLAIPRSRRLVEFPRAQSRVALPVRFDSAAHFIVTVSVAGRDLRFLLDSGASGIVVERDALERLGIAEYGRFHEDGGAAHAMGSRAMIPAMRIGPLRLRNVAVTTVPSVNVDASGARVVGLLGFDFIDQVALELDYARGTATAYDPAAFVPPAQPRTLALGVRLESGIPLTDAYVNGALGTRFALDTGSGTGVLIFDHFRRRHARAVVDRDGRTEIEVDENDGVGGRFDTQDIGLETFSVGDITYSNATASVVTSPQAYTGDVDGLIGPGILGAYTVYTDYARGKVFLVRP